VDEHYEVRNLLVQNIKQPLLKIAKLDLYED